MIKQHFDTCVESQVFARLETVCISSLNRTCTFKLICQMLNNRTLFLWWMIIRNSNCLMMRRLVIKCTTIVHVLTIWTYILRSWQSGSPHAPLEIRTILTHRYYYRYGNQRYGLSWVRDLFYRTTVTMAPVLFHWCSLSSKQPRDTHQVSSCQKFNEGVEVLLE